MPERIPLLFAPGFQSGPYEERGSYVTVLNVLRDAGFDARFFQPNWRDPRPDAWAAEMANAVTALSDERNVGRVALGGFSCGALVAALAAEKIEAGPPHVRLSGLLACSMSPWFGADWVRRAHQQPSSDLHGTSPALNANLSALQLPALQGPVQLYGGTLEMQTIRDMHLTAHAAWPGAVSIRPHSGHNIFAESYLQAIAWNAPALAVG